MKKNADKTTQTKADIQDAFWHLYSKQPIESITVQNLCDIAGYNRSTFYLHFHDMYELLNSIEEEQLCGMKNCAEACLKKVSKTKSKMVRVLALKEAVSYYDKNEKYIKVLLGEKSDPAFIIRLKDELKPLWREYVVAPNLDESRSEEEIDLLLEYTLSGSLFMISMWFKNPGEVSAMQLGHLIYDLAIRDISARVN